MRDRVTVEPDGGDVGGGYPGLIQQGFGGSKMTLIQQMFAMVDQRAGDALRVCHRKVAGVCDHGFQGIGIRFEMKSNSFDSVKTIGSDQGGIDPVARRSGHESNYMLHVVTDHWY